MSSKTLAVMAHSNRLRGAVIESSIGSFRIAEIFDQPLGAAGVLPVTGPFDRVVAAVGASAAAFRILDLPFRDRRRVSQAVGPTLEDHVPFSLDDGVLSWDFAGAQTGAAGASVLAAIAGAGQLDEARASLTALGIETAPQRLLWEPTLIVSAYRRALGENASFTAVDFSEGGALVARVIAGALVALRIVSPCEEELLLRNTVWSLATVAGTVSGASDSVADDAAIVVGGSGAVRLGPTLGQRLYGRRIQALPSAAPIEGMEGHDWRSATALTGLLIAASGDALAPVLDFESVAGSFLGAAVLREVQDEARPMLRWGAAALALAIVAVGIDYVQLFVEQRALSGRAESIYTSAMPSASGGAGRKLKMEMRFRELTNKAETSGTGGAGSPLSLLASLSRDVPKNLDVIFDQVEHAPPNAKVFGHAPSFETVTKMQEALQKSGAFSRVEVKDAHASVTGGGVEFLLDLSTSAPEGGA